MRDGALLEALLASPRLTQRERQAFGSMLRGLADRPALSYGQRSWAQGVGAKLGLDGVADPGIPVPISVIAPIQGLTPKRIAIVEERARRVTEELLADRKAVRATTIRRRRASV